MNILEIPRAVFLLTRDGFNMTLSFVGVVTKTLVGFGASEKQSEEKKTNKGRKYKFYE